MITQEAKYGDPRGEIVFDEYERNGYVSRFLEIFNSGLSEEEMCSKAYQIHCEIRNRHELYIAVNDRLEWKHKNALHLYAQARGVYANIPKRPKAEA